MTQIINFNYARTHHVLMEMTKERLNVLNAIREILWKKKIEDLEEEHQQDLWSKNFMVLGVKEREDDDENFIKQLINDVGKIAIVSLLQELVTNPREHAQ